MTIKPRNTPAAPMQLLIFIALIIGMVFAGCIIGLGLIAFIYGSGAIMQMGQLDLSTPNIINALWIFQISGMTIPLFIASILFAFVIGDNPKDYLKPSINFPVGLLLIVFCLMFISLPLIQFLTNINQKMNLTGFLKPLQDWMREKEDAAEKLTGILLRMDTFGSMIKNVLLIGLLTAIAEEFMFRGVIQTIFTRWTKNPHTAIWITAILFSAFHMEFFGFLTRMMLGVLLGYLVFWSGSIWPAVWAHFINNGTAVVATYLYQHKQIKINPDDQQLFNYKWLLFSLIIVVFLLYMYQYIASGKHKTQAY